VLGLGLDWRLVSMPGGYGGLCVGLGLGRMSTAVAISSLGCWMMSKYKLKRPEEMLLSLLRLPFYFHHWLHSLANYVDRTRLYCNKRPFYLYDEKIC